MLTEFFKNKAGAGPSARDLVKYIDQLDKLATSEELRQLSRKQCDVMGKDLKTVSQVTEQVDPLLVGAENSKYKWRKKGRSLRWLIV